MQNKKQFIKTIKFHLQIIICLLLYIIVTSVTGIGCPVRRAIHMPCPACGITRSWIEVFKFNFSKAFDYHPLFLFLPVYVWFVIHSGTRWMNKVPRWLFWPFMIIGGAVVLCVYVYRIINGFGPV